MNAFLSLMILGCAAVAVTESASCHKWFKVGQNCLNIYYHRTKPMTHDYAEWVCRHKHASPATDYHAVERLGEFLKKKWLPKKRFPYVKFIFTGLKGSEGIYDKTCEMKGEKFLYFFLHQEKTCRYMDRTFSFRPITVSTCAMNKGSGVVCQRKAH